VIATTSRIHAPGGAESRDVAAITRSACRGPSSYGRPVAVVVVGAGIAGVACARELAAVGIPVRVLERDGAVGGRMASPEVGGRPVDLGAAYFTVRDPEFAGIVERWRDSGLARQWAEEVAVFSRDGRGRSVGPMRWSAPGGLASLVADLADGLDVELGRAVHRVGPGPVVDGEAADTVVLAMPDPQGTAVLDPASPGYVQVTGREWHPAIAVAAAWPQREWPPLPAAFVNDHPVLTALADDGDRRGDGAPVLVAHTTAAVAHAHRADPDAAIGAVLAALRELLGVTATPVSTVARYWPYASPAEARERPFHLGPDGVAFAGDGWGSPRVETAWRSGTLLGREVAARLGAAKHTAADRPEMP
jgi:renalase